ncbi:ATP-binding cassette domain-containing protein [Jeotgalibaca arthritidis]|uniref:ABC transporter ATP-binding protein n=1 Tax=Jeotgalibaca arthritidis TaxID=1868794 RepID=A0A6G7K8S9_9LACT|nr:ABC transporter ATP-binding protein [Jeotgalibaca arthritidis]QII81679.1 ABC transporter ATP-binding protein [Jeotgalibaca arthritidis]
MLKLKNITKKYGNHVVLNDITINFDNPEGVYGVLGRNGVGKTTLMKIIFNMITNYDGEVEVNGQPAKNNDDVLQHIVYVGGEVNKYNGLFQGKIKDLLKAYSRMYDAFDREYAESMFESFDIKLKNKFMELSTGNKTLVQNTLGLATRAPITILDEPTNGLDSVNRQNFFRYLMEDYAEHPRLFMLSTHLIQEVENYLTNVVILKNAEVLIDDTLENIQLKAHTVKNARVENKQVIKETTLGSSIEQVIYDDLSDEDIAQIKANGGELEPLDLQSLFNALVEK